MKNGGCLVALFIGETETARCHPGVFFKLSVEVGLVIISAQLAYIFSSTVGALK